MMKVKCNGFDKDHVLKLLQFCQDLPAYQPEVEWEYQEYKR